MQKKSSKKKRKEEKLMKNKGKLKVIFAMYANYFNALQVDKLIKYKEGNNKRNIQEKIQI